MTLNKARKAIAFILVLAACAPKEEENVTKSAFTDYVTKEFPLVVKPSDLELFKKIEQSDGSLNSAEMYLIDKKITSTVYPSHEFWFHADRTVRANIGGQAFHGNWYIVPAPEEAPQEDKDLLLLGYFIMTMNNKETDVFSNGLIYVSRKNASEIYINVWPFGREKMSSTG